MQITIDPLALSQAQREHIAGFIITFPTASPILTIDPVDASPSELTQALKAGIEREEIAAVADTDIDAAAAAFGIESAGKLFTMPDGSTLDKAGLPWDERIHASSKTKTVEGNWRKRRGVADDLVATVEAELRQVLAIPALMKIPQPPAVIPNAVATGPETLSVTIPPPPPPVDADPKAAFTALVNRASLAVRDKKITMDELNALATEIGLPEFRNLAQRLDLVPQLSERLDLLLMTR